MVGHTGSQPLAARGSRLTVAGRTGNERVLFGLLAMRKLRADPARDFVRRTEPILAPCAAHTSRGLRRHDEEKRTSHRRLCLYGHQGRCR